LPVTRHPSPVTAMAANQFTPQFYSRFYKRPRTRVTTKREMHRRALAVGALVQHLDIKVSRILDAGCGLGWMREGLLEQFPRASYVGLEVSEHLCEEHGWVCDSLARYRARAPFDLIVCYDVLQYLSETEAVQAMKNLGRLSRGALYFHTPTKEDWECNADRSCSDGDIRLRSAEWYRARLARQFRHAGFGIHVRRGVPLYQWELERAQENFVA
jgi:SAM-dependent methyltransferase